MQRYRYTGPDASRDLAISGGVIRFPRMEWVNPEKVCEETGIDPRHLDITLAGLGEDWQAEGPVKAARTRKQKAKAEEPADPVVPQVDDDPAQPDDEEQA